MSRWSLPKLSYSLNNEPEGVERRTVDQTGNMLELGERRFENRDIPVGSRLVSLTFFA
jgi:hypothetical protein